VALACSLACLLAQSSPASCTPWRACHRPVDDDRHAGTGTCAGMEQRLARLPACSLARLLACSLAGLVSRGREQRAGAPGRLFAAAGHYFANGARRHVRRAVVRKPRELHQALPAWSAPAAAPSEQTPRRIHSAQSFSFAGGGSASRHLGRMKSASCAVSGSPSSSSDQASRAVPAHRSTHAFIPPCAAPAHSQQAQ